MIFIYSGESPALDRRLRYELGKKHRLLTIPFSPDEHWAAVEARDYFIATGIIAHTLSSDAYQNRTWLRDEIFSSDAVYLSGGNTYQFLDYARSIDLFSLLDCFETNGGIIVAESAGSIILSPDISTAAIPTTSPDENNVGLTDFHGMGRLPFHVSPHFEPESDRAEHEITELQRLAELSNTSVLMLQDGGGVVLDENELIFSAGSTHWIRVDTGQPSTPLPCDEVTVA